MGAGKRKGRVKVGLGPPGVAAIQDDIKELIRESNIKGAILFTFDDDGEMYSVTLSRNTKISRALDGLTSKIFKIFLDGKLLPRGFMRDMDMLDS